MRYKYLDFLRQIALFYMFFQHSALVLLNQDYNTGFINFLFEIVPICPALFLFLAGFSLTIYFNKRNNENIDNLYFFRLIKRGIILIICAWILFFIEHGIQLPDILIAGSILNSIGWMIIISAVILKLPYKKTILLIFILILIMLTIIFEKFKIFIIPFNYGYEPMSPTIIFGFIGLSTGLILNSVKKNKLRVKQMIVLTGIIGIIIISFYTFKYGWFKVFYYDTGRYTIERTFDEGMMPEHIFDFSNKNINFYSAQVWNYNTDCFIASIGAIFILFSLMYFLEKVFQKYLPKRIFLPGEFAFINYFFHLGVISIIAVSFGFNFMSKNNLLFFLLILFVLSYVISYFAYKIKNRKNKA